MKLEERITPRGVLCEGVHEEFERFIGKVQKLVNNSENPVEAIAYGEITKKKRRKSGVNVSVYNPKRILIDGMSYNEILYKDITKNI